VAPNPGLAGQHCVELQTPKPSICLQFACLAKSVSDDHMFAGPTYAQELGVLDRAQHTRVMKMKSNGDISCHLGNIQSTLASSDRVCH
jgi:hypothetical protein